ncbi:MAG: hypothetical protein PUP91_06565 [Rhizonema sp. PD37]|nr:hypothetical protein [Rhizonema sp. PD37]
MNLPFLSGWFGVHSFISNLRYVCHMNESAQLLKKNEPPVLGGVNNFCDCYRFGYPQLA